MSRPSGAAGARAVMLGSILAGLVAGGATTPANALGNTRSDLVVELDTATIDAGPGERFGFTSTVRNTGEQPSRDLVAHLNILTTDADVYVDPEDWSPERTKYLDVLPPGETARLTWSVQAVTSGPLVLYVAVTDLATGSVAASGPMELAVSGQRVVDSGGVLPLVTWMPVGVLALLAGTLVRRRLHR